MNYEESGKENMTNKNGVIVNVSGGQFAHAEGNAKMYVIQDNSIKGNVIDDIIKGIGENLSKIKKEDADEIETLVKMVMDELGKPKPKVNRLKNHLTLVSKMLTIANGIPILMDNIKKLQDIIMQYIK